MALNELRAFRGLCYDGARVGSIGDCLAPPYDVIGAEERERLAARHPSNIVHLTLGLPHPGDDERENVYRRAAATLGQWKREGILVASPQPSLWLYEESFEAGGRSHVTRGVLAAVRLHDFAERRILPHEKVMARPVEDRMRLTLAAGVQLEPIWGFYRGREPDLRPLAGGEPELDLTESGVRHRVWRLSDPARCERIARAVGASEIFIADGHHRYQTMLNVRDELRRARPGAPADAPWEFILIFLVNADLEELTVLPYHRLVHGLGPRPDLLGRLEAHFAVRPVEEWEAALAEAGRGAQAFVLALAGSSRRYLLSRTAADGRLDVEVLDDLVLRGTLGLTEEDLRQQRHIDYTHSAADALERVASGAAQAAFLMNPTPVAEIEGRARSAKTMPRKSSFFYPKPLSGIVLYPMGFAEGGSLP